MIIVFVLSIMFSTITTDNTNRPTVTNAEWFVHGLTIG